MEENSQTNEAQSMDTELVNSVISAGTAMQARQGL